MKISDILTSDNVVIIKNSTSSKKQILMDMCHKLAQNMKIDALTMFDIIWERENLGSTAFGGGTALPHGRIPGLHEVKAIFYKLIDNSVDFDAADNQPVDLIFMMISPENSGADHLGALAQISKILKNQESCSEIRHAKNPNDIYRILTTI